MTPPRDTFLCEYFEPGAKKAVGVLGESDKRMTQGG
jgi:hypothetical protein